MAVASFNVELYKDADGVAQRRYQIMDLHAKCLSGIEAENSKRTWNDS